MRSSTFIDKVVKIVLKRCDEDETLQVYMNTNYNKEYKKVLIRSKTTNTGQGCTESVRREVKIVLKRCDEDEILQKYLNAGRDKECNFISMQCDDNIQKLNKNARSMVPWLPQRAEIEIPDLKRTKA